VEDLAFDDEGSEFVCAHADGSYVVWTTDDPERPKQTPFSPYGHLISNFFMHASRCINRIY